MNEKWFSQDLSEIEKKLKTNAASGLSPKVARSRYARDKGQRGRFFLTPKKSLGAMLGEILADFVLILLIFASVIALCFDEYTTGLTLIVIISLNLMACVYLYFRTQRLFEAFAAFFQPSATVIRDGRAYCVSGDRVVPGDVVLVSVGDLLCFDARIVTSDSLRVRVRVERDKYVECEKYADGAVRENENDVRAMTNMLHAGSEILSGSARVIVTDVGRYTYLGARTGGIRLPFRHNVPRGLRQLRRYCSGFAMVLTLMILPFSFLCMLFSKGDVTLLITFTSILAVAASSMSQLSCTVCRVFFERQARLALSSPNSSAVRSVDVMDQLISADYLFLLDGCGVTDGVLHYDSAYISEGPLHTLPCTTSSGQLFSDMVGIFANTEKNALSTGVSIPGQYEVGLKEFLKRSQTDCEALKIRCPVSGYVPGNSADGTDKVFFTENGKRYILSVSHREEHLLRCGRSFVGGDCLPLTDRGRESLVRIFRKAQSEGKHPLVFSYAELSDETVDARRILAGILILSEKPDEGFRTAYASIRGLGVRVISFVNDGAPPRAPMLGNAAEAVDFRGRGMPVTAHFGTFSTYIGFNEEEILTLLLHLQEQGKRVAVMSFRDQFASLCHKADVFISCSSVKHRFSGYFEEEIETLEVPGEASGSSCTQVLKVDADVIVPRPHDGRGGLRSLFRALVGAGAAYHNLACFFRYMICTQFVRMVMVLLPMVFTEAPLDARHLLFCGFLLDLFAMMMFATQKSEVENSSGFRHLSEEFRSPIFHNAGMILASILGSLVAIGLPRLVGRLGFVGGYFCETEYSFVSMILLHLAVLFCLYGENAKRYHVFALTRPAMITLSFVGLFLLLCFVISPLGVLFDMLSLPPFYLLLTVIPPALCVAGFLLLGDLRLHTEKEN